MKRIEKLIYIQCFCLLCSCCSNSRLETIIAHSGNRCELEKVLNHYSNDPADSLKLQAAIFLIENMPGHYTLENDFMYDYWFKIDTSRHYSHYEKQFIKMIPMEFSDYRSKMSVNEDVKFVRADYLIYHIDFAFRLWESKPWLQDADFETFKEYILPYRIDIEPLDYWRDSLPEITGTFEKYVQTYDNCRYSVYELFRRTKPLVRLLDPSRIPDDFMKRFNMQCIHNCKVDLLAMRTLGIPSAIDIIPYYADRNGSHHWVIPIDPKQNKLEVYQAGIYTAGKIYRMTYSHNKYIVPQDREYVPKFFKSPFYKDVTGQYIRTCDVDIPFENMNGTAHAYLNVFNDRAWQPIAWCAAEGNNLHFENMGMEVVYLPGCYDQKCKQQPLAPPFILYGDGVVHFLLPDKDSLQKMVLTRKYPQSSTKSNWYDELDGCVLQASCNRSFDPAETLYQITAEGDYNYQYIDIDTTLKRRYWRIYKEAEITFKLADLQFYDVGHSKIYGTILETEIQNIPYLSDEDPLTMADVKQSVTIDFGKPVSISKIRYLGRNDANGIYPGNEYELFYYDFPKGWVSLGKQSPGGYQLEYDNVPSNGVYWLRNLTAGVEERIFTWENGKARFW